MHLSTHQKMKETNTENDKKLRYPHTAGKKSFASICEAEMDRIQSTQETEDGSQSVDVFASVMGPEHPGRLRLYGREVTKTSIKRKVVVIGTFSSSTDEMLQQKIVEMEERMQQRMLDSFNAQKDATEQQFPFNIISQHMRLNPDLQVDPSMLSFNARSQGDVSSAQQAAVQLMNRPSTGSNNRVQYVLLLLIWILVIQFANDFCGCIMHRRTSLCKCPRTIIPPKCNP